MLCKTETFLARVSLHRLISLIVIDRFIVLLANSNGRFQALKRSLIPSNVQSKIELPSKNDTIKVKHEIMLSCI